MIGNLFIPNTNSSPFPCIVITGAWTTVKEQMPNTYAKALCQKGYATITFDFRGWGESRIIENELFHYMEDPFRKSEDIQSVFNEIKNIPELDENRVAGLGICASAGYMSHAVSNNKNVQSMALIAPWLHNKKIIAEAFGGQETIDHLIQLSQEAKTAENPVLIEAASNINEHALMYQKPYYTEENRGLIPEYDNQFNVASWENWLTFDSVKTAKNIDRPVFIVHSEKAAVPSGTKQYLNILDDYGDSLWLNEADQFDFYDTEMVVNQAVDAVSNHFDQTM